MAMAKGLCFTGILIAIMVLFVFLTDLVASFIGLDALAPFRGASRTMDIVFVICAAGLGYISWATLKEQI